MGTCLRLEGHWNDNPIALDIPERLYGYGFMAWLGLEFRNYHAIPEFPHVFKVPIDYGDDERRTQIQVKDLLAFDYDQVFEDRRYSRQTGPYRFDNACTYESGQGVMTTYREFLGPTWFKTLEFLKTHKVDYIICIFT